MFVLVIKTPDGDAPEVYRKAWCNIIFKINPSDIHESGNGSEYSINGELKPSRKHFMVDSRTALRLLSLKSLEAVGYFVGSWPEDMYHNYISFGWDEVEELTNNSRVRAEYDQQLFQLSERGICDD